MIIVFQGTFSALATKFLRQYSRQRLNYQIIFHFCGTSAISLGVMTKKPVLLQILPALHIGGVERGTLDIARAAAQAGYTSLVVSSGGPLVSILHHHGSRHITLDVASKNPWKIWRHAKALAKIIQQEQVDIIHVRSRAPAWSAWLATRKTKRPLVTTFHGFYQSTHFFKRAYNGVMTRGDRVIAVSQAIREHIVATYPKAADKTRVIHRGVDLKYFDPDKVTTDRLVAMRQHINIPDHLPLIVMPARLSRWKGHALLLDALALLRDHAFFCLFVGGHASEHYFGRELLARVEELGLQENIGFAGTITDMPALYKLSDLVVSASTEPEAFGRIAIEAGAMERPIIATALGGSCETVLDGVTGWLVTPEAAALAEALHRALALPLKKKQAMGKRARTHIQQHFSLAQMCEKTLALYAELLPPH
jgi:glycosyltransferase involved in cell wall biosynthesis